MKGAKKVSVSRTIGAELDQRAKRAGVSREELMSMTEAEVSARVSSKMQAARAKHLGVSVEEYKVMTKAEREIKLREVRAEEAVENERKRLKRAAEKEKKRSLARDAQLKRAAEKETKRLLASVAQLKRDAERPLHRRLWQNSIVDHASAEEVQTDRFFGEEMQSVVGCMSQYLIESGTGRLTRKFDKREQELFDKFDKLYRGHVYRRLLQPLDKGGRYGFHKVEVHGERIPMLGNLSGAEVFAAVWAKLFGVRYEAPKSGKQKKDTLKSYFLEFDFSRENVGRGAFRAYLDEITYTVFREMTKREVVPLKDVHGRVMRDTRGRVIYVPRDQFDTDDKTAADFQGERRSQEIDERNRQSRIRLMLELSFLAYYRLQADERVCPRWFRPFAEMIFAQGKDDKEVRPKALASGSVPSVSAFDKELSCFRKKIRKLRNKMLERIYSFEIVEHDDKKGFHMLDPKEVLEREWNELGRWIGDRRMQDVRYNVVRGIMGN